MPFLSAEQNYVQTLPPYSADRLILEFLLKNAVGCHNA